MNKKIAKITIAVIENNLEHPTKPSFTTSYYTPFDPKDQKQIEKIFSIGLENRTWNISISPHNKEVEISFCDQDTCFGWLERISLNEFFKRLTKANLYITWNSK